MADATPSPKDIVNASPPRIPIRVRAALAAGSALLLAGCANTAQPAAVRGGDEASGHDHYPVTVHVMDDSGKKLEQTVGTEPKRVVVIGQALAEQMVEFGLDDRIVGVGYLDNSYSKYADRIAKLPKISDQLLQGGGPRPAARSRPHHVVRAEAGQDR